MVDSLISTTVPFVFDVPQRSVLGPVPFPLYSKPLSSVLSGMAVVITNMLMTQNFLTVCHLVISLLLSPTFTPVSAISVMDAKQQAEA